MKNRYNVCKWQYFRKYEYHKFSTLQILQEEKNCVEPFFKVLLVYHRQLVHQETLQPVVYLSFHAESVNVWIESTLAGTYFFELVNINRIEIQTSRVFYLTVHAWIKITTSGTYFRQSVSIHVFGNQNSFRVTVWQNLPE